MLETRKPMLRIPRRLKITQVFQLFPVAAIIPAITANNAKTEPPIAKTIRVLDSTDINGKPRKTE
ncbi:hypothetical protein COZ40_02245 [Candidatus Roizmanbacteria bacterium CG_4_10_14_3_um_filter_39_13]|uniref:Uncharacterized protein n=1 Tax=Candidatus Roizmanbacteria bacterium CG_4_10_14_3_um_filter_39_13 TaxID=1974831 RepID=A0A2M7LKP8_9BACT|nr:MAG: hypothetical protein COZ40_02245 [Candidatus Roizmanbacteria bacterium CG_4_10_14_3_um_filter_39_13]